MRPFGLARSLVSLALCRAAWGWDPTDSIMDADSAATGYLPNHNMDPAVIGGGSFGQIWSFSVPASSVGINEQFYAKPLVYTPKSTGRQVVIAFSEQNRIYVLDAVNGTLYNMRDMSTQSQPEAPFYVADLGNCNDISGTIGITGTPVIDNGTDTIYFWAKSYMVQGQRGYQNGVYRFHAIDAVTLQERPGFPTWVEGVPADNDNTRYFTGGNVLQRTSLNLINGVVYAGFGGHCDLYNYTGWVVGMRANTGAPVTLYSTSAGDRAPDQDGTWNGGGGGCGIWQSGAILSSDNSGRLFFATGNGYKTTVNGQSPASGRVHLDTLSECIVNMAIDASTGVVTQQDYFEPYTYQAIDSADRDLGSGGVSILPFGGGGVNRLAVTAGKNGQCYVTNADNLGGYKMAAGGGDAIIQIITPPTGTAMFGNVGAYPLEGGYMYITPVGAPTYAYALGSDSSGKPAFSLAGQTPDNCAGRVGTGSATITTLDGQPGTAVLWITDPDAGIKAYSAVPNGGTLKKITLPATPTLPKFQRPVFGNGRYYTTTYTGQILGFGSPVQLPFDCGGPFNFGEVAIGQSSTINITCVAKIKVNKIANITVGNPLYNISYAGGVPQGVVAAGQSFTFPATFNLTGYVLSSGSTSAPSIQPGVQSGSITLVTVNGVTGYSTNQPLSVTGTTVSQAPFAAINPVNVDFSPLVLGSAAAAGGSQNTMVVQNLGKGTMQILGYAFTTDSPTAPSAQFSNITQNANGTYMLDANGYFTTTDLPAVGSTIPGGSSVIVHMTFLCSTLGDFYTTFAVWTDGGMAHSVLTGSANSQPVALLEYSTPEGGWATIPDCVDPSADCAFQLDMGTSVGGLTTTEMVIRFTNTGGSDLMMDKSKPPLGKFLGAENPNTDLSEGMVIRPGKSATATMFFSPGSAVLNSDPVVYSGAWTINVNDLTFGVHVLNFTGTLVGKQVGPALANGNPRFKYLGCYQDSTTARIETTQSNIANNSNGACQQFAVTSKAAFAGTEYTTECWVGRNIPPVSLRVDDYLCQNYICPGDKTQFCGGVGSYVMMWYDVTGYFPGNNSLSAAFMPPAYKKTVGNYVYYGCRTDSTAARTLSGKIVGASSGNTIESCAAACAGYTYFGVEYGTECYCGNTLGGTNAAAVESTCSYTCAGDPTELCGGSSRISVYVLNGMVTANPSSSTSSASSTSSVVAATPSNLASVGGYSFVDCHTDAVAARTLQGSSIQSATMTVEYCASYCAGFTYFGVEYSAECYCGNVIMNGATTATDGRCSMVCNGNSLELCGGASGLSLYQLSSSVSSSSSVSVSASSTPSSSVSKSSSSSSVLSVSSTSVSSSSVSSSSSMTSSSTSSAATTPTVTVTCPSSNGTIFTSANGKTFLLECYIDHFAGDLSMVYVSSYAACCEACSTTTSCVAFSWLPGISSPCYMKQSVGQGNSNNGVWGAEIVSLPAASSSSSSTSLSVGSTSSTSSSSSSSTSSTMSSTSSSWFSSSPASSTSSSSPASSTSSTSSSVAPSTSSSSTLPSSTSTSTSWLSSASSTSSAAITSSSSSSKPWSTGSSSSSSSSAAVVTTISSSTTSTTSSVSPTATLPPWSYTGCANDSTSSRSLNGTSTTSVNMTVEMCQQFCSSKNYPLAGVEYSTQCYCGLGLAGGAYGQTGCTMACGGDSAQTCGGKSRLSVYRNNTYVMPQVVQSASSGNLQATLRGCFVDNSTARVLSKYTWMPGSGVSVETCMAKCGSRGWGVFGVEYGGECYCGDAVPTAEKLAGSEWECRAMFCNGDSREFCGGSKRILVYA
ncbi:WSC domain-containing protein [Diplogelasinospora grovesii]|uniref:WSC domain-containing protein n=1 Tax=Diplogelasinospora grovesii TaxID=303347 RepID=A0AAN6S8X7_9PEZI|nr:WSC domain-containing protein [Diplogelasinospora grovesii]